MSKATILIVDDDCAISRGVGLRMQARGYETRAAFDGRQALELVSAEHPDAIILDVRMPRLDGLETLEVLRSNDDTAQIPVVMLSASLGDRDVALKAGASYFLAKPFRSDDLVAAVKSVLEQGDEVVV